MAYSSQGTALIVVSAVFPALALATIILRLIAKSRARKKLDASDHFIFFAMLIAFCNSASCIAGAVADGMGNPLETLTQGKQTGFMKVLFATQFFYIFSVFSVKVSIILFYKGLFVNAAFRKVANAVLVVLCAWVAAFFFVTLFQDKPISRNWGANGTTVNFPVLYIVENLTNEVLDIFILCMPLAVIKSLQISRRKKWLLSGIFWLGAFCVVASTVRLAYFVVLKKEYRNRSTDFSSTAVNTVIWGEIEPCTSIMAACLPTLGTLLPGRSQKSRQTSYALTWNSKIHKHTSVNIVNHAMDSTEHFARDLDRSQFGTRTEIEGRRASEPQPVEDV